MERATETLPAGCFTGLLCTTHVVLRRTLPAAGLQYTSYYDEKTHSTRTPADGTGEPAAAAYVRRAYVCV